MDNKGKSVEIIILNCDYKYVLLSILFIVSCELLLGIKNKIEISEKIQMNKYKISGFTLANQKLEFLLS